MSKLEKMIAELCPDGVEYKSIREIAEVGTGNSNGNESVDNGLFPFFVRSQTIKFKDDYEYDEEAIIIPGEGGIGEIFHYINGKYALHQRVYRIHFIVEDVNTKFAYYYMQAYFKPFILKKAVSATVTSIRKPMIEDFPLPVPPLPVQREIVRILDNFTELSAELTTELTARKKQYEFYRDKLLTFGDVRGGATSDVIRRTLGEVCKISAGGDAPKDSMSKQKTEKYSVPIISNGIGENALYGYTDAAKIEEPAVTVAARGTIGYAEYRDYPFYPIIRLLTAIPKDTTVVNTKYLYYCLQGKQYSVPMGGIPQLTAPELKKVEIPIPSIQVQKRIVNVLDNFDAICSDLKIGLPAEIEARKKQYEFYREKLLAFHEISN